MRHECVAGAEGPSEKPDAVSELYAAPDLGREVLDKREVVPVQRITDIEQLD
jgi:hypothetical protein